MRYRSGLVGLVPLLVILALALVFATNAPTVTASINAPAAVENGAHSPALLSTNCTAAEIPQAECEDLVALYTSTGGPSWSNKLGWNVTDTPCSWHGVTCDDGSPRHVIELALDRNNLSGTLPTLTALTALEQLDLFNNSLSGPVPDLSALTSLKRLDLFLNQLTGAIPPSLFTLATLEYLDLSWNQLDGPIPDLAGLGSLGILRLNKNALTGSIPSLSTLTNLQTLDLSENRLSGPIPNMSALADLSTLLLDNNRLSGEIPASFTALPPDPDDLTLDLSYNMLLASNPTVNSFVDGLQPTWETTQTIPVSDLTVTPDSSTSVDLIWNPYLYTGDGGYFIISYRPTTDLTWIPAGTPNKTAVSWQITTLDPGTAYYFRVQTYTPAHGVQQNDLWSDYATKTYYGIPSAEYDTLVALYDSTGGASWNNRSGWRITDTPCAWHGVTCGNSPVTGIQHVTGIDLSSNNLIGSIPALSALEQLETLDLGNNQLGGAIPSLSALNDLKTLDLSNNQLGGTIPTFPSPSSLTDIRLGNNQLQGPIPSLSALASLETLYLWNNALSGDIPNLSTLDSLKYFNANNNQLTGSIPDVSALDALLGFWVSGNKLGGSIPDFSTNNSGLLSIALDNNQLSGDIPASFTTLSGLNFANLGYNQLTASDPSVIAFLTVEDPDWAATQTVPVSDLQLQNAAPTSIDLTWEPIAYTGDGGYYEILYATNPTGPWTVKGQTSNKSADQYVVTELVANTHYYFKVKTFTPAHGSQQNALESVYPEMVEYHVYWTLISEQELFARMHNEIASNPFVQEITFVLADFAPGAIRITVATTQGEVGTVVTSITSNGGLTLLTINSITLNGKPAPAGYTAIINRELMPLLVGTLNTLLDEKMGTGLDLDSMRVTNDAIEAAFPPP